MRGHEPLIAMRMRGKCPSHAHLTVGEDHAQLWRYWQVMPTGGRWGDLSAHIEVRPDERLSALDLRCLVGMTAHVIGHDEVRTIRVAELCQEAGCKSCFVSVHDPLNHEAISGFFYTEEVPPWQEF